MTVSNHDVVDWLGLERGTRHILLTIIDDLDWEDEDSHIFLLQEKLNTYLAFIQSDEVFERLREEIGTQVPPSTPVKVTIMAKYPLSDRASKFLQHAEFVFSGERIRLAHKVVNIQ